MGAMQKRAMGEIWGMQAPASSLCPKRYTDPSILAIQPAPSRASMLKSPLHLLGTHSHYHYSPTKAIKDTFYQHTTTTPAFCNIHTRTFYSVHLPDPDCPRPPDRHTPNSSLESCKSRHIIQSSHPLCSVHLDSTYAATRRDRCTGPAFIHSAPFLTPPDP